MASLCFRIIPKRKTSISIFIIIIISLLHAPLLLARQLRDSGHPRHALTPAITPAGSDTWTEDPALPELKRYLHRFGYLPAPAGNFTDLFDENLKSALSLYQSRQGIPVTGVLDTATLSQLSTPRCGVGDNYGAPPGAAVGSKFAFFRGRPSWDRPRPFTLTYAFAPGRGDAGGRLATAAVRAAFQRSFARWAEVIPVRFEEVDEAEFKEADVRIGFYAGAHGDGEPFDGPLGILGHAFSPESGRLHLDAAETWALDFSDETSPAAIDLESVATHEIGHVLGLGHTTVKEAVMYPSLKPRTRKVDLRLDDVEGAQALYGSNPRFRFSSLIQSETSAASSRHRVKIRWRELATAAVLACLA